MKQILMNTSNTHLKSKTIKGQQNIDIRFNIIYIHILFIFVNCTTKI